MKIISLRKNEKKYESLVRSFYQPLYRYAFWSCKNRQVAEDLVQETFARAWKNLAQLKEMSSAKPWLFTILNRENARRFARKQLPMVELSEEWHMENIAAEQDNADSFSLQRAIFDLEDEYREPIVLQVIGGFSTDEIASILQLNSNTVSTRLFRARPALKKVMSPEQQNRSHSDG